MTFFHFLSRKIIIPAIALTFVLSACDSSNAIDSSSEDSAAVESFDIAASVAFISDDLELTSDDISSFEEAFSDNAGGVHEPGFLWNVAARLQANLTPEQKERLFDRISNHPIPNGQVGNGHSIISDFMRRRGEFGKGFRIFDGALELTDQQVAEMKTLREQFREGLRSIAEAAHDGTINRQEARAQMKALAEELKTAVENLLTDEQKSTLEDIKAEHEARRDARTAAEKEAMIAVLGLDAGQIADLEELHATIDEERGGFRELLEGGATMEEIRALAEAAAAAHREALAGILDQTQYEIFVIHGALAARMKNRGGPGGFARPYGGPAGARDRHLG